MTSVYTPPSGAPYATGWDWIGRARRYVEGPTRPSRALLAAGVDALADSVTVALGPAPRPGAVVSVGLETMYVWSVTGSTVKVLRGADNSPAQAHDEGDLVLVDPRVTSWDLWVSLQEEVASLTQAGLWTYATVERDGTSTLDGVPLPDDIVGDGVVRVQTRAAGDASAAWRDVMDWDTQQDVDPTEYGANGYLRCRAGQGDTIRITYRALLGQLTDPNEDPVAAVGLQPSAADIPPIGAALRMLSADPPARANPTSQPVGRRPTEVSVSDTLNSPGALRALRQQRINEERSYLLALLSTRAPRRSFR